MSTSVPQKDQKDATTLAEWLRERVAHYLNRPAAEIAGDVPLAEYGLDSVYALTLATEIEDEFDMELDPTVMWDYSTIAALSGYLADVPSASA